MMKRGSPPPISQSHSHFQTSSQNSFVQQHSLYAEKSQNSSILNARPMSALSQTPRGMRPPEQLIY